MVQGLGLEQAAQLNFNGYAPGLTYWWRLREADTHVNVVEARAKRESSLDMSRRRCMSLSTLHHIVPYADVHTCKNDWMHYIYVGRVHPVTRIWALENP